MSAPIIVHASFRIARVEGGLYGKYVTSPDAPERVADIARRITSAEADADLLEARETRTFLAGVGFVAATAVAAASYPLHTTVTLWIAAILTSLAVLALTLRGPAIKPVELDIDHDLLRLLNCSTSGPHFDVAAEAGHGSPAHRALWEYAAANARYLDLLHPSLNWESENVDAAVIAAGRTKLRDLDRAQEKAAARFADLTTDPDATAQAEALIARTSDV